MKILLTTLNSKYVHTNLALKYLYSVVAEADLDVEMQEFTINNEKDYVFGEILRGGYDLVCFSCYIWNIEQTRELAANLKKACPELKILLGGPEVSYDSIDFMDENPWVDFIIRGEGEYPFFQFCRELVLESYDYSRVSSLTYRVGDMIRDTADALLPVMDKLPFPYNYLEVEQDRVVYYESSRGCPFRCSYCLSSLEKSVRRLPLDRVRRDIGYLLYKDVKQVKFIDRTFNYDRERANDIWNYIIDKDNGKTNFHFEICADMLDSDSFRVLSKARPGLMQFEIGVQSANPYTLQAVDRDKDVTFVLRNVRKLMEMGNIHIHVDLIAGLPHEDYRSFARSFNTVYSVGADNLQLGFLKLLKGSKIREEAGNYGYIFRDKAPYEVISNDFMSSIDIIKLKMVENVLDLYHNRGGFERTVLFLKEKLELTWFNFYEMLADFYYSNDYQHAYHSKEDMYRIIYKFAMKQEARTPGISLAARELLQKDMADTLKGDAIKKFNRKGWNIK